jgi:predicted RNA-binding protein YlqC (UPF0109 family)
VDDDVLKELLTFLARSIVDDPDQVTVDISKGDRTDVLTLKVAPDDMGKVIGKRGRIATALRTIVRAAATKEGKHIIIEIVD